MPVTDYYINDSDDVNNSLRYEGYERADGEWYITRITAVTNKLTEFRYVRGASDYATAWANRAAQTYQLFGTAF